MAKVKVKTLIGATAGVLFFLTATVAFLFYAFPQWLASATGLGPYQRTPVRVTPMPLHWWCSATERLLIILTQCACTARKKAKSPRW